MCMLSPFRCVQLSAALWTAAHQAPLSMEILQAGILEWVAVPRSRASCQPRDRTTMPPALCSCWSWRGLLAFLFLLLWCHKSRPRRGDGKVGQAHPSVHSTQCCWGPNHLTFTDTALVAWSPPGGSIDSTRQQTLQIPVSPSFPSWEGSGCLTFLSTPLTPGPRNRELSTWCWGRMWVKCETEISNWTSLTGHDVINWLKSC